MTETIESLFEQFKQLPDWQRYPLPDAMYSKFNIKKLQPASVMECAVYTPPPHLPLGDGKLEVRKPVEGGVRPVEFQELPVELQLTNQSGDDNQTDSAAETSIRPIEDNNSDIPPLLGPESSNLSHDVDDSVRDVPCRDAECNPPFQRLRSESFSTDLQES